MDYSSTGLKPPVKYLTVMDSDVYNSDAQCCFLLILNAFVCEMGLWVKVELA
jgi:hypothetical protein